MRRMMVAMAFFLSLLFNGGMLFLLLIAFRSDQLNLAQKAGVAEGQAYLSVQLLSSDAMALPLSKAEEVEEVERGVESEIEVEKISFLDLNLDIADIDLATGSVSEVLSRSKLTIIAAKAPSEEQVIQEEALKALMPAEPILIENPNKSAFERKREEKHEVNKRPVERVEAKEPDSPKLDRKDAERKKVDRKNLEEIQAKRKPQDSMGKSTSTAQEAPVTANAAHEGRSGDQFAQDLMNSILQHIEGCYPEASKRRGEQGVVELILQAKGAEIQVVLVKSSGYPRLDRCAKASVERALKKSNIKTLPQKTIKLKPIRFQLR